MTPIMVTKLLPPRSGSELIERPRLLELFSLNKEVKLIVLAAPAGYGKTVATLQYVNTLGSPFIWYQLDRYDNDPAVFVQYLIAGIGRYFPGFGTETLQLVLQSNITSSLRLIVITLINELANLPDQDLTLILDDYHVIFTPDIHQFIQELLEYLPVGIRLVMISRISPPLNFSRYQVAGEMVMFDSDTLRFTVPEAREFIAKRQLASSQEFVDSLLAKTEGWPAVLKLLTASAITKDFVFQSKNAEYIYDYLANEVLDHQPEEIRDFLISTAVLESVTPEMCDLLLERNDSRSILDRLEKQQLLLIPLAGQSKAYRYHQLFRDFLLERLGSRKSSLLHRVGEIAAQNGDWDHAIEYLTAAGISQDLIPLIIEAGRQAFHQGRWQTVERWLGMLTREAIAANEWLALFQARIDVYRGKLEEAEAWVGKSLTGFTSRQDPAGIAECRLLEARILRCLGRCREGLQLLEQVERILAPEELKQRFDLPMEKMLIFVITGHFDAAEAILQSALETARRGNDGRLIAHLFEGLGNIYYFQGQYAKSLQCYQQGAETSPEQILPSYYMQDSIAMIYQDWGELDKAFEYAERSVALKEKYGLNEALPSAYVQLASIWVDKGDLKKAEELYNRAIQLIRENKGERFYLKLNLVFLARCLGLQNRWPEARERVSEALQEDIQSELVNAVCQLVGAMTFIRTGNPDQGSRMLNEAVTVLERISFPTALIWGYTDQAWYYWSINEVDLALESIRKSLNLAARLNLLQHFITYFEMLCPILTLALARGIEPAFIQRIMVRLGKRSLDILLDLVKHPDGEMRRRIIGPLTEIGGDEAIAILRMLGEDRDVGIRQAAQAALQRYHSLILVKPVTGVTKQKQVSCLEPGQDSAPVLQIDMLGPVQINWEQTDITGVKWRFTKSRDLLLYLAQQGQPVGINRILEDLWPEIPLEKGLNLFYGALHWLRQVIQKDSRPEMVTYRAKTCYLQPAVYTTDRRRFGALINEASAGGGVLEKSAGLLEEAVALYRGEYLNQLDYPWVIPEREHLKRLYLESAIRLTQFYLQNQDHLKAVKLLEPLADQNPLREEIFGLLLSAYAGLGDRLAVIGKYQQLKANLDAELGLKPALEITKLYYRLCGMNPSCPVD
jgi:LuxR family maltose regulon positive regulatory protein